MIKLLKYLGIYFLIIIIMSIIALEMNFEILTYLTIYGLVGVGLFYFLKHFKFWGLKVNVIFIILITSIFSAWLLTASYH